MSPVVEELYQSYKKKGIRVVGILLTPADTKYMKEYRASHGITFPIVYGNAKVVEEYHIEHGVPAFFFIDKNGMVRRVLFGEASVEVLEELADEVFKPFIEGQK